MNIYLYAVLMVFGAIFIGFGLSLNRDYKDWRTYVGFVGLCMIVYAMQSVQ